MAKYNGDILVDLDENEIMVFGSNLAGRHGAGAAKYAHEHFGAVYGLAEGIAGRSYAFPTLDGRLGKLSHGRLLLSAANLFLDCDTYPELTFIVTKVGCGLAGYDEEYMRSFFLYPAPNMVLPEDWQ